MVSRDRLMTHGLRAYELGRLKSATRVALLLVPLAVLCLMESDGREACACFAVALLGLSVWLRWRRHRGFEVVTLGLKAGSLPLLAGLLLDRFGAHCGIDGASALCVLLAVLAGTAAGAYIGATDRVWRGRLGSLLTVGTIAVLAAALGCVRLGVWGVASVTGGIALGIAVLAVATSSAPRP